MIISMGQEDLSCYIILGGEGGGVIEVAKEEEGEVAVKKTGDV